MDDKRNSYTRIVWGNWLEATIDPVGVAAWLLGLVAAAIGWVSSFVVLRVVGDESMTEIVAGTISTVVAGSILVAFGVLANLVRAQKKAWEEANDKNNLLSKQNDDLSKEIAQFPVKVETVVRQWKEKVAEAGEHYARLQVAYEEVNEENLRLTTRLDERVKKREIMRQLQDKLLQVSNLIDLQVDWNNEPEVAQFRATADKWHDDACDLLHEADCLPGALGIFRSVAASEAEAEFRHLCQFFGGNTSLARCKAVLHAHRQKLLQIVNAHAE